MDISKLGKFGLIDRLAGNLRRDDAVVVEDGPKAILLADCLLLEGIHFDLTYVALKFVGYKAAGACFSDMYAMNARPRKLTVSVGLSKRFSVENVEELFEGIRYACERHGVELAAIDVTSSLTGLCIATNCIGEAEKKQLVSRRNAKNTDLICVSGDLGAAYMGLQLLEREKAIHPNDRDFTPDFAGKEYLLERQLRPEARKDIVELLAKNGILPTAMLSVTDGLASELLHLCRESGVGCAVYEERIPIDYQTAMMAEKFNMNLTTVALNGGDDYELLFTVPLSMHEKVEAIDGITLIGHITPAEDGANLIARDGTQLSLKAQGWTQE